MPFGFGGSGLAVTACVADVAPEEEPDPLGFALSPHPEARVRAKRPTRTVLRMAGRTIAKRGYARAIRGEASSASTPNDAPVISSGTASNRTGPSPRRHKGHRGRTENFCLRFPQDPEATEPSGDLVY